MLNADTIRTQLEKLLASKEFSRSERLCRFLRFVVKETLEGRESELKEYLVGIEAFGKDETYNPSIDPIVRVEARRLRAKLKRYYRSDGREDPILIDLKKGGYVPEFRLQEPAARNPAQRRTPAAKSAQRQDTPPTPSIAVLPFANLSTDPEIDLFCDGLTEEILSGLVGLRGIRVAPRTSVFAFKGKEYDLSRVASELQVGLVLEGSVRKAGTKVRVSVRLVDVANSDSTWSGQYDHELSDVLGVQDQVTEKVVSAVQKGTGSDAGHSIARQRTESLQAYRAYLKGRYYWDRRTVGGIDDGVKFFTDSIESDPSFAPAHAGLAECYSMLELYSGVQPDTFLDRARSAARRSIELDPASAEGHTSVALLASLYDWNGKLAELHARKALELNPGYPTAHIVLGRLLVARGEFEVAADRFRKARELDPMSPLAQGHIGFALYQGRRYQEAVSRLQRTLLMDPEFDLAHLWLALANLQLGRYEQASLGFAEARRLSGERSLVGLEIGCSYALAGDQKFSDQWLSNLTAMSKDGKPVAYYLAVLQLARGERQEAWTSIELAAKQRSRSLCMMHVDPLLDRLRNDARFQELTALVRM